MPGIRFDDPRFSGKGRSSFNPMDGSAGVRRAVRNCMNEFGSSKPVLISSKIPLVIDAEVDIVNGALGIVEFPPEIH
jgi:hypothetical protein